MAADSPDIPGQTRETVLDDLMGVASFLADPEGAARRLDRKWFWLWALLIASAISLAARVLIMPLLQHILELRPIPANVIPEQFQRQIAIGMTVQRIANYFLPLILACILAVQTLILWASASVAGMQAKFRSLFNLTSGCSVIPALAALAGAIVVRAKGEPSTVAELQPAFGLDMFLDESTNRFLLAFLGYFSVFEIWWIAMVLLVLSAGFGVSKSKAGLILTPVVILGLILHVVSAAFQR
jgi:hypothetical protein